ncbi:MAG: hypothetical protein B7C54_12595 [Acidimicrobiales bacterium mtb01]|nr:hypothetical protein [Actinomycetota bacterium]TEX45864.1 MAG: hypothetical protein B7C54_12595 [Acidimicrobiales bacterium mtb01]
MPDRRLLASCALIACLPVVVACGATTFDDSRIAPSTTVAVVVTIPQGSAAELLPRLADEMAILSSRIGPRPDNVAKPDGTKIDQLTVIEAIWTAAVNEVEANDPDAAETLARMVAQARTAVERNRPADADKAAKFARIVIDEYLADF